MYMLSAVVVVGDRMAATTHGGKNYVACATHLGKGTMVKLL
jgi:diphthamide biosynthesis methyltransferase